jgi:hypothetical protein
MRDRVVINRGIPGQQSFELLARFDADVAAAAPRAVLIWGFINDIFRAPPQQIDRAVDRVKESYISIIKRAKALGIEPLLATEVTIRPQDSWKESAASWLGWVLGRESYQDRINRHVRG